LPDTFLDSLAMGKAPYKLMCFKWKCSASDLSQPKPAGSYYSNPLARFVAWANI
jgi:hypothetical protein